MKKNTLNINKLSLLIALFMIEFATFTKNIVFITNYSQVIINIAIGILLINSFLILCKMKADLKKWIIYSIIIIISFISYIHTKDGILIQLSLILICSINIDFDDIVKKDVYFKMFLFIFILLAYFLGAVNTAVFWRENKIRYALGFNQPNTLGYFLISWFFEYCYLQRNKIKWTSVVTLSLFIYALLSLAESRTAELVLILFLILYSVYYLKNKKKKESKIINKYVAIIAFILFTILSFYVTYEFANGNSVAKQIDSFLSGRLYWQNTFLNQYNINLLGNNIDYFYTLDNAYIRTILNFGWIVWVTYAFVFNKIVSYAVKRKEYMIVIITLVLLVYGLMEWYVIRPVLNIFLIYFTLTLSGNVKGEEEYNE